MAWTTPTDRATGYIVTASVYNAEVIENLKYLHGDSGVIALANIVQSGSGASAVGAAAGWRITTAGTFQSGSTASTDSILLSTVSGDATDWRFVTAASGTMSWGTGSGARDTTLARVAASVLNVDAKVTEQFTNTAAITVPTTWTPTLANGLVQRASITAGGAATLTIGAVGLPPSSTQASLLVLRISNAGGGTVTLSWNAAYASNGTTVLPASVASGAVGTTMFAWDGTVAKWILVAAN